MRMQTVLQQRLDQALASWPHWATTTPKVVQRFSAGLSNNSFMLRCEERGYVLRIDGQPAIGVDRQREARVESALSQTDIAARVLYRDANAGFSVREFLPGQRAPERLTSKRQLEALLELVLAIHAQPIHTKPLDLHGHCERYWQALDEQGFLLSAELHECRRLLLPRWLTLERFATTHTFCHHDLNPHNLVIADASRPWRALDWEYAMSGNPLFELAGLQESFAIEPALSDAMLELYAAGNADTALELLQDGVPEFRLVFRYLHLLWSALYAASEASPDDASTLLNDLEAS